MADIDLNNIEAERPRKIHLEWVFPTLFKPAATFKTIGEQERSVWLTPLLLLSLLAIIFTLMSAPARIQAAQAQINMATPPDNFQWWSEEQQQQWYESQSNKIGPMFIYVFPALGELAGVWIPWLLLGSILNIALTLNGSRGNGTLLFNLTGWSMLPLAVRYVVRAVAVLISGQVIQSPGLSGLVTADGGGFMTFLQPFLAHIDVYVIWMLVLLIVGVLHVSGLPRGKAIAAVAVSILLVLALQALPGFIGARLSGLSTSGIYF
jgi:hypothetical protein